MVDLQGGKATLVPRPGARVLPAAVFDALRQAGFRCDAVTVEASGEVKRSGSARFFLPGIAEPFLVIPDPAPPDGPARVRARILPDGKIELLSPP